MFPNKMFIVYIYITKYDIKIYLKSIKISYTFYN